MMILGLLQLIGGVLVFVSRAAKMGLALLIVNFAISVAVISMTGKMGFAAVSILPVLLGAGLFLYKSAIA